MEEAHYGHSERFIVPFNKEKTGIRRLSYLQIRFLHQLMKREIPKGGFLVNGAAIKLMGVNRHDFHPDLGRAVVIAIQAWKLKG